MNRNDPRVQTAIRTVRRNFEEATGLRTYSIPFIRAGQYDLFEAERPWNDRSVAEVAAWLDKAKNEGGHPIALEVRNTRMTVRFEN